MKTILFTTLSQANQYIEENHLRYTGETTAIDDRCDIEYYDPCFFEVVGSWSGEIGADIYDDGDEEIGIAWWYGDGDGPTVEIGGETVTSEDLDGVYTTNGDPAEIDKCAVQYILVSIKLNGYEVLTSEDDEDEFEDCAAKLDFNGDKKPSRIFRSGDIIFAITKDYM